MSNETSDPQTTIELPAATIELLDEVLVLLTPKRGAEDLEGARSSVDAIVKICLERGRKVRLIVDIRNIGTLSREARIEYQSERSAASVLGNALIVDSGVSRVIGNFFIGLNKGSMPTRLFTTVDAARAWLEGLPDE